MRLWGFWRRKRVKLHVMRLEDMRLVHPQMDDAMNCSRCGGPVGVYPSGLEVIRRFGRERVDLVCSRCEMPDYATTVLAPGALTEPSQSTRNH